MLSFFPSVETTESRHAMSVWIISGEASGDDYGAGLARSLHALRPDLALRGMGGPLMRAAGVEIIVDSTELGVVGFTDVLKQLPLFLGLLRKLSRLAETERPEAVVLIDYPGFNLRLAKRLHRLGIPVVYYVSPQVWAWKKGRIHTIAKNVDRLLCIFPFEPAVYAGTKLDVRFIGHPLLPRLQPLTSQPRPTDPSLFLLLPGSRTSELKSLLPIFLQAAAILKQRHPELHFALPLPRPSLQALAEQIMRDYPQETILVQPEITIGETRRWLRSGVAGMAASGTVTVESAILDLPLVVSYRVSPLTWWVGKQFVKLSWLSILNLVTNKGVYHECLQDEATPQNLAAEAELLLEGGARRQEVLVGMSEFRSLLGENTDVDDAVAAQVLEVMKSSDK